MPVAISDRRLYLPLPNPAGAADGHRQGGAGALNLTQEQHQDSQLPLMAERETAVQRAHPGNNGKPENIYIKNASPYTYKKNKPLLEMSYGPGPRQCA